MLEHLKIRDHVEFPGLAASEFQQVDPAKREVRLAMSGFRKPDRGLVVIDPDHLGRVLRHEAGPITFPTTRFENLLACDHGTDEVIGREVSRHVRGEATVLGCKSLAGIPLRDRPLLLA